MRISDWSSDVCSSDLLGDAEVEHPAADTAALQRRLARHAAQTPLHRPEQSAVVGVRLNKEAGGARHPASVGAVLQRPDLEVLRRVGPRSEEHTSELQSLMRILYADFCLTKKK